MIREFKENFFEALLKLIGVMFLVFMVGMLTLLFTSEKKIIGHYIQTSMDELQVWVNIDNWPDGEIELDRVITYEEAIQLVKELDEAIVKE